MTIPFGSAASRQVIIELQAAGYETVFVGGAVRDTVLGKEPMDIDITTAATPEQVKRVFSRTIDIGIEHGTVLVLMHGEPIEVTTFRTESTYSDKRRPDEVSYVSSLQEDLKCRDFTINALAMTVDGEMIDLFDGLNDLEHKVIRSVGDPHERFGEDPLRIFRALRFSSVLDFEIESKTLAAMKELAPSLCSVAIERIKVELDKLFQGGNPSRAFQYSCEINIPELFPQLFAAFTGLERYVPFIDSRHGYAAMLMETDVTATVLVRDFKLSNEEKRFLKKCEEALAIRSKQAFEEWDFYTFPTDVLEVAERIHFVNNEGTAMSRQQIAQQKSRLPLQQRTELAFTGNDLLTWSGKHGGKWTSEWIQKIERAVVHGRIKNDAQAIKDWFIDEITREK